MKLSISFEPQEGQDRNCKSSRETVFSYIRASDEARGEFSSKDVIGSFGHIYWCWNEECANIWRSLRFHKKHKQSKYNDLLPEILNDNELISRIDEEIQELLASWQNKDPGVIITPITPNPSVLRKDRLN